MLFWSACTNGEMTQLMCGGCKKTLLGQVSREHFGHVLREASLELQYSQQIGLKAVHLKSMGCCKGFWSLEASHFLNIIYSSFVH